MDGETAIMYGMFAFSPVGSRSSNGIRTCLCACMCVCVCVCVCGRNELEVCSTLGYPHIGSFRTVPVPQAHAHMLPQTI